MRARYKHFNLIESPILNVPSKVFISVLDNLLTYLYKILKIAYIYLLR